MAVASPVAADFSQKSTQFEELTGRKLDRATAKEDVDFSGVSEPSGTESKSTPRSTGKSRAKMSSFTEASADDGAQEADQFAEDVAKCSKRLETVGISTSASNPSGGGDCKLFMERQTATGESDSGVASPKDDDCQAVVPTSVPAPTSTKQRTESGETPDGGLGSSVCGDDHQELSGGAKGRRSAQHRNGSDSGQGSEADDGMRMAYQFYIPTHLCGRFIGSGGCHVKQLKQASKCSIQLHEFDENGFFKPSRPPALKGKNAEKRAREESDANQICLLEGTRSCIDHCLDLIRQRFPVDQFPELSTDQINLPSNWQDQFWFSDESQGGVYSQPLQLGLTQGVLHDVCVSNIVCAGHVFLQQPGHPTHASLVRLQWCMENVYANLSCPDIPREFIELGLVCVARCEDNWHRVQVVRYDATSDTCDVKLVDLGGFYNFPVTDLKQIRSDFLTLPFQALECYLGNVMPPDDSMEWSEQASSVLSELVSGQVISGRMLGVNEEMVPIVHLYGWVNAPSANNCSSNDLNMHDQQPRLLNRELVDRGVARWTEHVMAS